MVVGEAKAVHVALVGDGKGEIGTTKGILESHVAPASPGFQHHTLGDQESFICLIFFSLTHLTSEQPNEVGL